MILLFSGGIDSYIAWYFLNKPPTVYFDLKTPYSQKEIKVIKELIPNTIIDTSLDLDNRQIGENAYIPFRNLYLAMLAVKYSRNIIIAGIKGDNVSDKNESIFEEFSQLLSKLEKKEIYVMSPFWSMTKEQIIGWYLNHYGNAEILLKTISCYSEKDTNYCGMCPSCFRKWCALRTNGIKLGFYNQALMREYLIKAQAGYYIPERNESIIKHVMAYKGYLLL